MPAPRVRRAAIAVVVLGVGLVLAPVAFQMFDRAPEGGDMLDEFRPYMDEATIGEFQGWMLQIGAAVEEYDTSVRPALAAETELDPSELSALDRLEREWPDVEAEMLDMLDDMEASLGNFAAVDALPPFSLFPWFFVLPGAVLAALGVAVLRVARPRRALAAVAVVGIGLIAAPAVFQMFTRAPDGKEMIDTFRPLMTREKVTSVQGHFLTMGTAEGELRRRVLPALADTDVAAPEAEAWVEEWPTISNEMAPMLGAMADNLDNFAAVDALPPFSLFPWFFVAPGVLAAALALWARRAVPLAGGREAPEPTGTLPEPEPESTRSP